MDFIVKCFALIYTIQLSVVSVQASTGDKSPYYQNCINSCLKQNCQNSKWIKNNKQKKMNFF